MDIPDPLSVAPEAQRRLSVAEYHRMVDAGVFAEGERVELLAGVLVAMSPQSRLHALLIQRLTSLLVRGVGEHLAVRVQLPLTLSKDSEPEPDFAVVPAEETGSGENHPGHALLVVEVAVGSARVDRQVKSALYAAAGIAEYWLVDARARSVEVLRQPDVATRRYRTLTTSSGDEAFAPAAAPGLELTADLLFRGVSG
jgi:Uma2 family endonuclease